MNNNPYDVCIVGGLGHVGLPPGLLMANLPDDYAKVDLMFERINEGNDIVCASRYIKGGRRIGGPWFKGVLSRIAGLSLHYLTGIPTHDISNSFRMYTKRVLMISE